MKLKDTLKYMFHIFCVITTFETLFIATESLINDSNFVLNAWELYKILIIAFTSVLPMLIFVRSETASRMGMIIRKVIHFVLTSGIVFSLLIYFKWMDAKNAVFIALFFLSIYIPAHIIGEIRAKQLADKLNERINAFHKAENATHPDKP